MRILSLLVLASASLDVAYHEAETTARTAERFEEFLEKFKIEYSSVKETMFRLKTFTANLIKIAEAKLNDPHAEYSHMTPFADRTEEEWNAYNNLKPEQIHASKHVYVAATDAPASYDWREHGAVSPIKDQKQCGSCWAFSTVSNVESANVVQGGNQLLSLSEQELVDCSKNDNGCNGGLQSLAYDDMINGNIGLVAESDYPYKGKQGTCQEDQHKSLVSINSWVAIANAMDQTQTAPASATTAQIMSAIVQYGPLAIALNATPMQFYRGGVASPRFCNPRKLDHAVNLVGYGTDNGKDYWIIRNSWNTVWGEKGYYRIAREEGLGKCGMNQVIVTATINKDIYA